MGLTFSIYLREGRAQVVNLEETDVKIRGKSGSNGAVLYLQRHFLRLTVAGPPPLIGQPGWLIGWFGEWESLRPMMTAPTFRLWKRMD